MATTVHDVFVGFGREYIRRFGDGIPGNHRKAMEDIIACRTPAFGMTVYKCTGWEEIHHVLRACGNRHCPNCRHRKTLRWLNRQADRQLPGHHFMITFTVPKQIRSFIRSNRRVAYNALFKASSEAMKTLSPDEKFPGGDVPGFFGVLHAQGRQMQYHPHLHYLAPGGAFPRVTASGILRGKIFTCPFISFPESIGQSFATR